MHHGVLVCIFQRICDLPRNRQSLVEWNRPGAKAVGQGWTLGQFHHEGIGQSRLFDSIDGSDIGVIERREKFRFALEACHALTVLGERFGKNLDRNISTEL
jgi:hypothetical protein